MEIKATSFYVDPSQIKRDSISLGPEESWHLVRVMRAKLGDVIRVIDGRGNQYRAAIESLRKESVQARIIDSAWLQNEPQCKVTLACGLSRPTRLDFVVEKGTELGVGRFCFFYSELSLLKEKNVDLLADKAERWRRLAIAAAKQSLRSLVPEFLPPVGFGELMENACEYEVALLADVSGASISDLGLRQLRPKSMLLVVGPESGLTPHEVELAEKKKCRLVSLGPRRLRVETAAISLVATTFSQLGG